MRKNYYRIINFYGEAGFTEAIWHCSPSTALTLNADAIIPLSHKPKAGTFEIIREGA